MLKKVLSLFLLTVLTFSVSSLGITVLAEEYETCELLWNGCMEWGHASYGFWSKYESVTDIVHSGTKAAVLRTYADDANTTDALVMNGADTGYFDDVTFKLKGKTGYTLRNLKTSTSDSSITVEYDINSHFTEDGGTVIYVFYDADGRMLTIEKEAAAFGGAHITRTFDKVDFASMKIFVWDSLGGMLPYSNVIQ